MGPRDITELVCSGVPNDGGGRSNVKSRTEIKDIQMQGGTVLSGLIMTLGLKEIVFQF